ncbi:MAG: carbohydrate kinase [Nanoarchaeota archaeon]
MLISFGELLVDMIKNDGEDRFHPYPGGAPANFSVALARLGFRSKLIASVGKDFFGDMLVDTLKNENVDVKNVKRSEGKTSLAFVELKRGVPKFIFYRDADLDIKDNDIDERAFINASAFHFGSLSLTDETIRNTLFSCLNTARMHGALVSFSPNIRSDLWGNNLNKHLYRALEFVDVLISSESEFKYMFGSRTMEQVSREYSIKKIAITRGENGCILYLNHDGIDGKTIEHYAFPVDAIDTTGAGDAFAAGFICSLLNSKDDSDSVHFASAVAALSTTKKGAMPALPTKKEVDDFLSKHD